MDWKTSFMFAFLVGLALECSALDPKSLTEWQADFNARYPAEKPEMSVQGDDNDRYAWQCHYWLRAYARIALLTGDTNYVRYGLDLIHHMFYYTDRERYKRGEIGFVDYDEAPVDIQKRTWCRAHTTDTKCTGIAYNDSNALAIGWRRPFNGKFRNEVLNDGMITQGMLRFITAVRSDARFVKYTAETDSLILKVKRVVDTHLRNFSTNRYEDVPGSFYYTRTSDPFADWGDTTNNRLYSGPVPFNHSATMSASMLLLDSLKQGDPKYRPMAENLLAFLKRHIRISANDAYEWNYSLKVTGVEDVGHGHVDLSFIHVAKACGLQVTDQDMERFARTAKQSYAGGGAVYEYVDGSGEALSSGTYGLGYDWIDLIPWNNSIYQDVQEVFMLQYPLTVAWSRPLLMWANLIYWDKYLNQAPVKLAPTAASIRSMLPSQWNLLGQRIE